MDSRTSQIIDSWAAKRVLVVGDGVLDAYLHGSTRRLCREAPVPVVGVHEEQHIPGGAANTAVNAASLGAEVDFLCVVGADADGDLLRAALRQHGVRDEHVLVDPSRRTLAKHRVLAEGQILLRFDRGSTEPIPTQVEPAVLDRLQALFPAADATIVSDYGNGLLTAGVIAGLERLHHAGAGVLAVDSRTRLPAYRRVQATLVKPNYEEVLDLISGLAGEADGGRAEAVARHGQEILELTGGQMAAVTLDSEGALLLERGREAYRTYARPHPESRATGAGDTFTAALTLALAAGAHPPAAAEIASAAAAVVVAKDGTASCSAEELRDHFSGVGKVLADEQRLAARVRSYRSRGLRIVFTNGCFDILHRGHIAHLNQAKALGDVLIVAVNSDAGVARLKGPGRPVNALEDRLLVLAALSCVDHVIAFDGDTSSRLIEVVRPDLFVKGGNYHQQRLPEAPLVQRLGGQVRILDYLGDRSTTRIIERVKSRALAAQG